MPLTAKHRSSLYQSLAPIVGEEEADALLSEYPGSEADSLVTTGQLNAGLAELRAEIAEVRTEIAGVRVELYQGLRRQTGWMVSAIFAAIGVVSAITSLAHG